jgi:hypothetical protein
MLALDAGVPLERANVLGAPTPREAHLLIDLASIGYRLIVKERIGPRDASSRAA